MKYTITPKRGQYLIGAFIFGVVAIAAFFIVPPGVSLIVSGFFGIFFIVNLIMFLLPSTMGMDVISKNEIKDASSRMQELSELHNKGLISDEEFAEKRRSILNKI
jgi:hypothetical protein